jgi:hypothetical protein
MRKKVIIKAETPHRVKILNKATALTSGNRDQTYGDPHKNMTHMAGMLTAYFSSVTKYKFTAEDAAMIMVIAKQSRCKANPGTPFHEDNYIDGAAYLAMAGASRGIQS